MVLEEGARKEEGKGEKRYEVWVVQGNSSVVVF
jgi:hypothetical protein